MAYHAPDRQTALRLIDDIWELLRASGGWYGQHETLPEGLFNILLIAVITGQFYFKRGCYFAAWIMVSEEGLQRHMEYKQGLPDYDVINGEHMRVTECGCLDKSYMLEIRRRLRKHGRAGVSWHREKSKAEVIHMNQRGAAHEFTVKPIIK